MEATWNSGLSCKSYDEHHSIFLFGNLWLIDGGHLWTFGSGSHGQLGHGGLEDEPLPRMVVSAHQSKYLRIVGDVIKWNQIG